MSFPGVIGKNPLKYFWTIQMLVAAIYKTTQTSAVIDRYRNGGYGALTLELLPGLWTDGSHTFAIQESDDNFSTNNAVAVADMLYDGNADSTNGTFTGITAATTTVQRIDYIGRKRYVRVVTTESGTTGAAFALVAHLFAPNQFPAA
jgi:hypothetical protein